MPGIGARIGSRILLEIGDGSAFPTPGHLAAYAGLTPVTRRSGSSIRGEHPNRAGNKKHNAAMICLARRRCDVLHAMLRHGTCYQDRSTPVAA